MVTKSLADITNSVLKSAASEKSASIHDGVLETSKTIENYLSNQDSSAVEANLREQLQASRLPLADSYIDGDETSKPFNSTSLNQDQAGGDYDDFNQPGSVYNPNLDDMLEPHVNLEVTPSKDAEKKRHATEETDEEDSDEDDDIKKSPNSKNKSPKQKRSYKKSLNNTNKDNTTIRDDLDEMDETLSDPSKNLTKRAKTMISLLNKSFNRYDNVSFIELTKQNSKKTVVQKFYSLLVLTKYEIIEVFQGETYGDIVVSKGDKFDNFAQNQS